MADNKNNKSNNDNNKGPNGKKPISGSSKTIILLIISVILTLLFVQQFNKYRSAGEQEKTYDSFLKMVENKEVSKVEIYSDKIYFEPKKQTNSTQNAKYYVVRTDDYNLVDKLQEAGVTFSQVDEGGNALITTILSYVIMIGAFYLFIMLLMRGATKGGGIMNVGKSNAKMYDVEKNTGVTFKDVAGEEEAKESLQEMVDFLNNPDKYLAIGAKLPKGALLVGPPGTGKTLLAKAVAGEAGVPFFSLSGSEFVEMYVGVGASRVRDLFKQANAKAPCIIFIDEIDAIGRSRDSRQMGGDSEREQTLNQLLAEMDGFDSSKGIVILAATNRPEVLDKALLRPGRFDRRVVVENPDLKGREDILSVHIQKVKIDETVNLHEIALATSGASGADLANIVNEAALNAVRKRRMWVCQTDLLDAIELVFMGKEKKNKILTEDEKKVVAYHEAGHALVTALQKHTMPVQKITIIPRTEGALGYVLQVPEDEHVLEFQDEFENRIATLCGGRAAEALKFNRVTSGASNDIEQATKIARAMVTMYGMSEKFGMVQLEDITGKYLDRRAMMNCSDETATKIDSEVKSIIKKAYNKAYKLLKRNELILNEIAEFLLERETITGEEFMEIYAEASKKYGLDAPELSEPELLIKEKEKTKDKDKDKKKFNVYKSSNFPEETKKENEAPKQVYFDSDNGVKVVDEKNDDDEEKEEEKMLMPWESFANSNKSDEELLDDEDVDPSEDDIEDLKKLDGESDSKDEDE